MQQAKTLDDVWMDEKTVITLYQLLKDVRDLFIKYGIIYWIDGGTLLGAVRNKGLIPWDDDVDLCIDSEQEAAFLSLNEEVKKLNYGIAQTFFGYKVYPKDGKPVEGGIREWKYPSLDVFITTSENGKKIFTKPEAKTMWPESYPEKELYPLKEYQFGEFKVMGPQDPYPFFKRAYGQDWATKGYKNFDYLNRRIINPPITKEVLEAKDLEPAKPTGPLPNRVK